jgi:DsbC/DsbD-like thiol-disulfide interchange protein
MLNRLSLSFRAQHAEKVAVALLFLTAPLPALAADASPWDSGPHSAVRLIAADAATSADPARRRAGVEILLQAGWKTYWRYPGDSGVPPRFDFTRSENVKEVVVGWPAPHRFTEGGDTSIGYKGDVTLPLLVVPKDASKPTMLRLDLDYAICEKMCVPASAKAEIDLSGRTTQDIAQESTLIAAEASVPKPAKVGDSGPLAIRSVKREAASPKPRVVVDVAVPEGASDVDLFAEGPTTDWALPVPQAVPGAPAGEQRFAFALDGLPSGASAKGAALRLTAVAGGQAIEVVYHLD